MTAVGVERVDVERVDVERTAVERVDVERVAITEVRRPGGADVVRLVGFGLVTGACWGWVSRLWMAFLVDTPVFTWSGTLFIVGLTTLAGVALATMEALRRHGARLWRLLCALPALVMLAGLGAFFAPAALFGGLAVSGRGGVGSGSRRQCWEPHRSCRSGSRR